jgi:hypothetical protein
MRLVSRFLHTPALLITTLLTLTLTGYGFIVLHSTGQVGTTLRDGGTGCNCHTFLPSDSVHVWITGPDSVAMGGFADYTVAIAGGPAVRGGFNVASSVGTLILVFPGTGVQLITGELTHTAPKSFQNDTVSWRFRYQAPLSGSRDTLFSVGNSTNGNGLPNGDEFNFGANFEVHLLDSTVGVVADRAPLSFELGQNYPNPFNPSTTLEIRLQTNALLTVRVYNTLGEKVAVLAEGMYQPGAYTMKFDGAALPSGIYYCRVEVGKDVAVRKMVLAR